MSKMVRRGFAETDEKEFNNEAVAKLQAAGKDIIYLLNKGYNIKGASTFVGDHYLLSARQRIALVRMISSYSAIENRKNKEIKSDISGKTIHIDGFNTIITLEVALSGTLLLKCMDGTVRDMAGLRGTYRLIDKTDKAIKLLGDELTRQRVDRAHIYLDAPVSNSGNLKVRIHTLLQEFPFDLEILCVNQVDKMLEESDYVVTSDSIILDKCINWINLNDIIISRCIPEAGIVDLGL